MSTDPTPSGPPIIAFQHLAKTAGVTVTNILKSTYGARHCAAGRPGGLVTAEHLGLILRVYPRLRSVSGHNLRAHIDYGEHGRRLQWFTMLRDPAERFHSHYRFNSRMHDVRLTFEEWCAEQGDRRADFQVRELAGAADLDKAKTILSERFAIVGDQGDFDASLRFLAGHIGDGRLPTSTSRVDNAAPPAGDFDRDLAERYNVLDRELYTWFREEIWPRQERDHGGGPDRPFAVGLAERARQVQHRAYHKLVYRTATRLAGATAARRASRVAS